MRTLVAVALLVPALALAQDAAPQLQEDPRAARFNDVERGFFIGFETGYLRLLDTPTVNREKFPLAGASGGSAGGMPVNSLGVLVGVDLGTRVSVALYANGASLRASESGYGEFSLVSAGADGKLALLGWRDRNDWQRLYLYVHGRAGFAWSSPDGLFGTNDRGEQIVAAGPGVEYFTKLRHFSIALGADIVYAVKASTVGFAVYPTIRYTF